jgi:hypothetical protein
MRLLALIKAIDNICEQLDNGSIVCGIYLNLKVAFDLVSHDIKETILMVSEVLSINSLNVVCLIDVSLLALESFFPTLTVLTLEFRKDLF